MFTAMLQFLFGVIMATASGPVKSLSPQEILMIMDGLKLRMAQLKRSMASEPDPAVVALRKSQLELYSALGFALAGQSSINY